MTQDSSFSDVGDEGLEDRVAHRYLTYTALNLISAVHAGQRVDLVDSTYHVEELQDLLDPLLLSPRTIQLVRSGGYPADFVALCEQRLTVIKGSEPH
jgi:hypothetical protein